MNNITEAINKALTRLEEKGDIVITTTTLEPIAEEIIGAIGSYMDDLLDGNEYRAVTNSLNVLVNDVVVNSGNFQTIIGLDKNELKCVLEKLISHIPKL